jgi:hypothetical protein
MKNNLRGKKHIIFPPFYLLINNKIIVEKFINSCLNQKSNNPNAIPVGNQVQGKKHYYLYFVAKLKYFLKITH